MDPPPSGCRLCGSTWGDWWADVEGREEFFCCELCAIQWTGLLAEIRRRTGWPDAGRVELTGDRWGRRGRATRENASLPFTVVFRADGTVRRFDEDRAAE